MSKSSDADFDLELCFLPAWAQKAPEENRYAKFEGEPERGDFRDRRGRNRDQGNRPPRRGPGGPGAQGRGGQFPQQRGPGGPQGGQQGGPRRGDRGPRRDQGRRPDRPSAPPPPLPDVNASIVTEERGVDLLARQIKMTGRAYPLFDIAQIILAKPDRYSITLSVKKNAEGQPIQPLFLCAVDDTPWLSEDEAVQHLLNRHFNLFYQPERTATEPPKGVYTFVAQCGLSGIVLGPPNYHDYQNRLLKLHAEKFSRMPFDVYKSRVRIVRDEAVVKKWIEDQSWKTEFVCLNVPEPLKLGSREEVENHFRQVHVPNVVKPVESVHLNGDVARNLPCHELRRLTRQIWEDQRRFPLQLAVVLSQQFASRGLQFFKVNKTVTHVAVARPHYLDLEAVPVSEGVRQIVNFINAHPKTNRRKLFESLAPAPVAQPPAQPAVTPPAEAPAPQTATEPSAAPEGQTVEAPSPVAESAAAPAPVEPAATPEQTAVIADLHWLIHQGHVIEFANGTLETAKKPAPKPVKAPPAPAPAGEKPAAVTEPSLGEVASEPAETAPPPPSDETASATPESPIAPPQSAPEPAPEVQAPPVAPEQSTEEAKPSADAPANQ